ncbi:MAG: hypothetical protein LUD72_08105, partial [Bacteroidales bacterium]|nr:hypothetical protein [Bacteroidales bacterium]
GLVTSTSLANYASYDISGTEDDIVVGLGLDADGASVTPTSDQIAELISKTTQTWTTVDGVEGMQFSASNGNSIFLPAAGYRDGDETVEDVCGHYWSGSVYSIDGDYANTLKFDGSEAVSGISTRYLGLAVRSVYTAPKEPVTSVEFDPDKIVFGDLEGNGNLRIEIYNEYGSTASDSPINTSDVYFTDNMVVTFTLSGISDNLKDDAPSEFIAGLEYADYDWWPGYWAGLETMTKYDAKVTGDGTYVVWMDMHTPDSEGATEADGAVVFCIDIGGLMNNISDASLVNAQLVSIELDADMDQAINNNIVEFNNKDGDGVNGRVEIYNEYGNSGSTANGYYNNSLYFNGMMIVEFTLSGIDGNLNSGVTPNYQTQLSFADADWWPAFWGEDNYGDTYVTGDGTYETYAYLNGDCEGAVCWTIEIYGLWQDLADPYAVTATVNKVTTPGKVRD